MDRIARGWADFSRGFRQEIEQAWDSLVSSAEASMPLFWPVAVPVAIVAVLLIKAT